MFEHYLTHHRGDPKGRLRLFLFGNVSAVATVGMLAFNYVTERLHIAQVNAPSSPYIMFQMSSELLAALPPPPPPQIGRPEQRHESKDRQSNDGVPIEKSSPPRARQDSGRSRNQRVDKAETCLLWTPPERSATKSIILPTRVARSHQPTPPRAHEPFPYVRARCDFCPSPDPKQLSSTRNGMFRRRNGRNKTMFCMDTTGKVSSVRTVQSFPGDEQVDAICRSTVQKWRVRPLKIDGRARKTCSTVTFHLLYE